MTKDSMEGAEDSIQRLLNAVRFKRHCYYHCCSFPTNTVASIISLIIEHSCVAPEGQSHLKHRQNPASAGKERLLSLFKAKRTFFSSVKACV